MEGKIEEGMEVTERRGRHRKQLQEDNQRKGGDSEN
jgi:hypothetical protein